MRALMAASSIGILIGASVGSAYLGGRLAHDNSARHVAGRLMQLASVSKDGKIDDSSVRMLEAADDGHVVSPTAMDIAMRFSHYAGADGDGGPNQNMLLAQNLTAMRTSDDMRQMRGLPSVQIVRASLDITASAAQMVSDHPIRTASAMVFKAHSQNDSDCLTQAVYYEARGEGTDGMRAVAQVILNRVRHPAYPKTICGVVYQGAYQHVSCQFSFVCNGAMSGPLEAWAWRRAKSVAEAALGGYVMSGVGTATSFHTTGVNPGWSGTMDRVAQIGSHIFYQFRGRGSHIGGGDNVMPSDAVPNVTQVQADVPADATGDNAATPTPDGDNATTQVLNAVSRAQSMPKPVTVSAQITGKSAKDIIAEVSLPAPTPTRTSLASNDMPAVVKP